MSLIEAGLRVREKRYELESAPGGWVVVRRLSHGERTERIDSSLTYVPNPTGKEDGEAQISQIKLRRYDFSHAIVDHNLAHDGAKLDFKNHEHVAQLDPDIGDELADLIDEHQVVIAEETERFPEGTSGSGVQGDAGKPTKEAAKDQ